MSGPNDITAAEYVLGLATPDAGKLDDPEFASAVDFWESVFAPLNLEASASEGATADDAIWLGIEDRLEAEAEAPGTFTVPMEAGIWETLAPGVERKVVHVDRVAGTQTSAFRMARGAVLPAHEHRGPEHCFVVSGSLRLGTSTFGSGTYHLAGTDHAHVPIIAKEDAEFFIHGAV